MFSRQLETWDWRLNEKIEGVTHSCRVLLKGRGKAELSWEFKDRFKDLHLRIVSNRETQTDPSIVLIEINSHFFPWW